MSNPADGLPPKRRKPMGKVTEWTDEELDAMSQITPQDIEDAKKWWEANAPKEYRGLLNASEATDEQGPGTVKPANT